MTTATTRSARALTVHCMHVQLRKVDMIEFELEFDGALLASSGIAESLHAAGGDARVWSHADDARIDVESPAGDALPDAWRSEWRP